MEDTQCLKLHYVAAFAHQEVLQKQVNIHRFIRGWVRWRRGARACSIWVRPWLHQRDCYEICQRTIQKGRVSKVPLGKLPLIDTPFKRIAVDIVGPIEPRSEKRNHYILTMIDYATRYPEAVA